ncbi:MAG: hypothetical protein MPJ78_20310, partial [Hyphomicrobiaceae bacterium]|nr:hypothetical protein [Hyphomicrobiaceae bacterium]
ALNNPVNNSDPMGLRCIGNLQVENCAGAADSIHAQIQADAELKYARMGMSGHPLAKAEAALHSFMVSPFTELLRLGRGTGNISGDLVYRPGIDPLSTTAPSAARVREQVNDRVFGFLSDVAIVGGAVGWLRSLAGSFRSGSGALDQMYAVAPAAKAEIDGLAGGIASRFGGHVATVPLKSRASAMRKILSDYGGDASQIRDLARNTIVVSTGQIDNVAAELAGIGARVKVIDGSADVLGYSGVNATFRTNAGIFGEIQVNSPAMIYAKESPAVARSILGDALYSRIASRSGLPGGLGHQYYEQWRVLDWMSPEAQDIARRSRSYYQAIRNAN